MFMVYGASSNGRALSWRARKELHGLTLCPWLSRHARDIRKQHVSFPYRPEQQLTDHQLRSINVALLLAEANPRSVVTISMSSWLANST